MASYYKTLALLVASLSLVGSLPVGPDPALSAPGGELALAAAAPKTNAIQAAAANVDRSGWTVTVDSQQTTPNNLGTNAIDGNTGTFWHTQYSPTVVGFPHTFTINFHASLVLTAFVYTPRQDGSSNGNIGAHQIQTSTDGNTWTTVAFGTYFDSNRTSTTPFTPIAAGYLRIIVTSEAGNRGAWTSAAEINVNTIGSVPGVNPSTQGTWGVTIDFPVVPVHAAVLPNSGKLLAWSAFLPDAFTGADTGYTQTATWDPSSNTVSEVAVTNINHDMFCSGISRLFDGSIWVTGGNSAAATTSFQIGSQSWVPQPNMKISRGYQASATTSTGNIFVIGGSWSGGQGNKNGELWSPSSGSWSLLPGAPVAPMLTADAAGVYRADNHGWLFGWKGGSVFQAGPSKAMNWYGTSGGGSQTGAGTRAGDADSMCGNAVMYDAVNGKILTAGGSPSYQYSQASTNAHIITIGNVGATPNVQTIASMSYARAFGNGVALPDGKVLVVGGQSYPIPFNDDTAQLIPELYNPATGAWTQVSPIAVPRVYHSIALLLPDGTVFNGGGGLCGTCGTNHFNGQIWTPPYLYTGSGQLATRPVINSVSSTSIAVGRSFTATTNSGVTAWAMMRLGSVTHTVDTDQRRVPLGFTANGNTYTLTIPNDPGIALPGYYYLFALNSAGVPSVSRTILITP